MAAKHLKEEDENLERQQPEQVHSQLHVHPMPSPLLPLECDHSLGMHILFSKKVEAIQVHATVKGHTAWLG